MPDALTPTATIDSDHPAVISFAESNVGPSADTRDRAVRLYYAVRDGFRYDPYSLAMTVPGMRASTTIEAGRGWCVPKAVLLAACCRSLGIPARLGFADVKNHLSTARLRKAMGTDVFYWHGYTSIQIDGSWVKATPAFNVELCEKFRIRPLEFDGTEDSIYHAFDLEGRQHMEYLRFHEEYDDLPLDDLIVTYAKHYTTGELYKASTADFDRDVDQETSNQPS